MSHVMYPQALPMNSMATPFVPSQNYWMQQAMTAGAYGVLPMPLPMIPGTAVDSTPTVRPMEPVSRRQNNPYASPVTVTEDDLSMIAPPQQPPQVPQPMFWSQQSPPQQQLMGSGRGVTGGSFAGSFSSTQSSLAQHQPVVTLQEVLAHQGRLVEMARTANGSSFIQSALRSGNDDANLHVIWADLEPYFADLLLDAHGCYVIKSILERLPTAEIQRIVAVISTDPQLVFSMCTHSLHTRRVVQYLLDTVDCTFILNLLTAQCAAIATTQQGCIIMQRAMDVAAEPHRTMLFNAIYSNLYSFAKDPFGNYVVQHMLEVGDRTSNSQAFAASFSSHVVELSCNKFASNVVEKSLYHVTPEAQHTLLMEMYNGGDEVLYQMLQDSFGNYIIQSSIALAAFRDVFYMAEKLRAVLQRTPYGHKIEARLERRLKGKPVGTRSPMITTFGRGGSGSANGSSNGQQQLGTGRRGQAPRLAAASVPMAELTPMAAETDSSQHASDDCVEEPW